MELSGEYMTNLENKLLEGKYDAIMVPDFERFALERKGAGLKWAVRSTQDYDAVETIHCEKEQSDHG